MDADTDTDLKCGLGFGWCGTKTPMRLSDPPSRNRSYRHDPGEDGDDEDDDIPPVPVIISSPLPNDLDRIVTARVDQRVDQRFQELQMDPVGYSSSVHKERSQSCKAREGLPSKEDQITYKVVL